MDPAKNERAASAPASARLPHASFGRVCWRWLVVNAVLFYFGVLRVLDLVGLRWLGLALVGRTARYERLTSPIALRRAFEVLGPTYVKLGQLVASGEALFPKAYSQEFLALLDKVPPFSLDEIEQSLASSLGARSDVLFARFDREPIAAASIAQVHGARLHDGTEVVVKVQRPGIRELAATDVVLMRALARIGSLLSAHLRRANLIAVFEDFETNLVQELDFSNEAGRMREFNEVMQKMGTASVAAPRVYDELSGPTVLTMERFIGWRLDDTAAILKSGFDPVERLRMGVRAWFQTLILKGFFHGDVHAGNFFLLEDGRIGYLDFGIVGTLTAEQKRSVLEYVLGFQASDFERVARAMIEMGALDDPKAIDFEQFVIDVRGAYGPMFAPTADAKMRDILPEFIRISRKHGMRMPRDLVLVTKQLVYLDRYSRALGGADMNVLTDKTLSDLIMQDMLAAMFA